MTGTEKETLGGGKQKACPKNKVMEHKNPLQIILPSVHFLQIIRAQIQEQQSEIRSPNIPLPSRNLKLFQVDTGAFPSQPRDYPTSERVCLEASAQWDMSEIPPLWSELKASWPDTPTTSTGSFQNTLNISKLQINPNVTLTHVWLRHAFHGDSWNKSFFMINSSSKNSLGVTEGCM